MTAQNDPLPYVREAVLSFEKIMASSQKGAMENLNRANKGELFVLHHLASSRDKVLPTELSAALGSSNARISVLLGVLEKKGQIERSIDKNNRRNVLVSLTPAGQERVVREMGKMQGCLAKVFTHLGEGDTSDFIRLLKRFSELIQQHMPNWEEDA